MKKLLHFAMFILVMTVASCGDPDPNIPSVGSGERTFSQAASVAGSHGSYWTGVIVSIILAGLIVYAGHRTYNQLKLSSRFKPDWLIRPLAWIIAFALMFAFIIHPIYQNQYY